MVETESLTPPETSEAASKPAVIDLRDVIDLTSQPARVRLEIDNPALRDARLLNWLGPHDFEYALESGLIDQFYYDPETGEDGITHVLAGNVVVDPHTGYTEVGGFHHPFLSDTPGTYETTDLTQIRSNKRAPFMHTPWNPRLAKVKVRGVNKQVLQEENEPGETRVSQSAMYPQEYDALAVLQTMRLARDTRDRSLDEPGRKGRKVAIGYAPMLDGHSLMKIHLILDGQTEQIVTGFPEVPRVPAMVLGEQAIQEALGLKEHTKSGIKKVDDGTYVS